ncbi:MAG TPA: PIG-L family deacetylase [Gemmatimonadaceae bacterium]|nr:PIG-L family deacetylase [Gemmatimonadaceae bacterium]
MSHRIGVIFAHPDDETFCVGATVAKYADVGITTDLYSATDGDAGKNSGVAVSSREELAAIRRDETRAAARILGIASIEFAGYGDGKLKELDATVLTGSIVSFIRRHKPTIILTFGPEGAPTGHRDHQAISRAATAAFFLSELRTAFPEQIEQGLTPHRASRLFYHAWRFPHKNPSLKLESVPPTAQIDVRSCRQRKLDAFMAHATQQYAYDLFVTDVLLDAEFFAFAAGTPQPRPMIDDLFDGL